jgi:hypothetical protein
MKPKEKAKELIDKYINLTEECDCLEYMCICFSIPEYKAKQCALIAVDEILIAITFNTYDEEEHIKEDMFWNEVKKEIKKL